MACSPLAAAGGEQLFTQNFVTTHYGEVVMRFWLDGGHCWLRLAAASNARPCGLQNHVTGEQGRYTHSMGRFC